MYTSFKFTPSDTDFLRTYCRLSFRASTRFSWRLKRISAVSRRELRNDYRDITISRQKTLTQSASPGSTNYLDSAAGVLPAQSSCSASGKMKFACVA
jgi:hypothetical protein